MPVKGCQRQVKIFIRSKKERRKAEGKTWEGIAGRRHGIKGEKKKQAHLVAEDHKIKTKNPSPNPNNSKATSGDSQQ